MRLFHSLKIKLILICTIASIFSSALLCWQIYHIMKRNWEREQLQTVNYNLSLITANIEREMDNLYQMVLFCSTNKEISRFTSGMKTSSYSSYPVSMTAYDQLNARIFNSSIDSYINKLILCSKTGEVIMQGKYSGFTGDVEACIQQPYFESLLSASGYEWAGLWPEPFFTSNANTLSLPVVRPLVNRDTGSVDGWIYIALSPNIVSGKLTSQAGFDSDYYWLIGDKAYRYERGRFVETSLVLEPLTSFPSTVSVTEKGVTVKAVASDIRNASWSLLQTLPKYSSPFATGEFEKIVIPYIFLLVTIFLILDFILVRIVSRPVTRICRQLERISDGEFSTDASLETGDEFGYIGSEINMMTRKIAQLIQQQLDAEQEKRRLELDNLQAQISPHFLYNTLYTVKWMAILQNAPGITEMLESLIQIMKNISKNTSSKTSLRDELNLLKHYLTIQTYRYGDSFTYIQTLERESLLDCQVFRFSLQPLLENAIFHGIGGRRKPGRIQLSVRTKDNDLFIHITDNGIGIPQSQIDRILSCDKEADEDQLFRKVGIRNINRRLKLEYGDTYGIFIQSQVDSYTEVIVRSPLIYPDNMKEQGDEQPCTQ